MTALQIWDVAQGVLLLATVAALFFWAAPSLHGWIMLHLRYHAATGRWRLPKGWRADLRAHKAALKRQAAR